MPNSARRTTAALLRSVPADRPSCPAPEESGLCLRIPVILVVGVGDEIADVCEAEATDANVAFVRVSQGIAACRAIDEVRPTVVALAEGLWRDERHAIREAAQTVGARIVE